MCFRDGWGAHPALSKQHAHPEHEANTTHNSASCPGVSSAVCSSTNAGSSPSRSLTSTPSSAARASDCASASTSRSAGRAASRCHSCCSTASWPPHQVAMRRISSLCCALSISRAAVRSHARVSCSGVVGLVPSDRLVESSSKSHMVDMQAACSRDDMRSSSWVRWIGGWVGRVDRRHLGCA